MAAGKIVLCTGANQGLGYGIIEVCGLRESSITYILASRTKAAGDEAVTKLKDAGVKADIQLLELDVTNDEQIAEAVKFVDAKYGRLDVLINNAGILVFKPVDDSLSALRDTYTKQLSVNLTSVAIVTTAFAPLLHKAAEPIVINVTSGLGSITNTLTKKMVAFLLTTAENDRIAAEEEKGEAPTASHIRFYVVQPGVLKTAFTNYVSFGKSPQAGAEAVVRLVLASKDDFPGGTYWEFEDGQMKQVPW